MATILLDSTIIFDTLNRKRGRAEYLNQLIEEGRLLACCPVNITEVYAGIRDSEVTKTAKFLNSLEFFPITYDIPKWAGLLKREWAQKGQTLSYTDVTIAAIALANGLPLLTDNRKHFPMPELTLYPLPQAS